MDYITGLISIWPSCARGSIPPVRGLLGNIPCPVGAEIKGHPRLLLSSCNPLFFHLHLSQSRRPPLALI